MQSYPSIECSGFIWAKLTELCPCQRRRRDEEKRKTFETKQPPLSIGLVGSQSWCSAFLFTDSADFDRFIFVCRSPCSILFVSFFVHSCHCGSKNFRRTRGSCGMRWRYGPGLWAQGGVLLRLWVEGSIRIDWNSRSIVLLQYYAGGATGGWGDAPFAVKRELIWVRIGLPREWSAHLRALL